MRQLIQLDDPSYFSELSEDDDADPIEFDARKLLFGYSFVSSMAMEGADILGGPCLRKGNAKRDRYGTIQWWKGLDDIVVFLGLKSREEM